jgi:hypothetical protein
MNWRPIKTVLTEAPRGGYCNLLLINAAGNASLGNVHYVSHQVGWILQTSHGLHKPTHWLEITPPGRHQEKELLP